MQKGFKILIVFIAVSVIIDVAVIFALCHVGLLGFFHPAVEPREGQIKVACVGDSVTYGYGIKNWSKNNYPAQLARQLGDGFCVRNFGYSGRCVQSTADRPYAAENLYKESIDFQPDIVVFMLGSNDSKAFNWNRENFIKDYKALVETYVNLPGNPKVIVMAPPPVFESGGEVKYHIEKDTIAGEIVPLVKEIAASMELDCIDLYQLFEGKPELFSDGCHPTAAGAALIAEEVKTAIQPLGK